MEYLLSSAGIISLLTLTFMEIVLGIDNIIFVSIVASRVEKPHEKRARNLGLFFAMLIRILLLLVIQWVIQSQNTLFTLPIAFEGNDISFKDLMLLFGGLFLLYKSTTEIHHKFNVDEHLESEKKTKQTLAQVVFQIIIINLVFSIDSIVTAIGLTESILIMFIAIIVSMLIMLWVSAGISRFVEEHPTVKMLALSFLLMIGCMLIIEAFEMHVPKGYIYFSMAFSLFVEMLNIRLRKKQNHLKR